MHFMAPVNFNNNGKASVVNSAHTETIFSHSDNCSDNSVVYVSCKLGTQTTKMAPRTVVNGTPVIQESPNETKFQNIPINGNCINSLCLATMSSSNFIPSLDDTKSVTPRDTNGVCKKSVNLSLLECSSEPLTVSSIDTKTISTSALDYPSGQAPSEPLQSFCRINSVPLDDDVFCDTGLRNHVSTQRSHVEQEYQSCLLLYNQYVSRLDALQNQIYRLSIRGAQLAGRTVLSNLKKCDTDIITESKDHVRSILETCARELDSDETESSSDEESCEPVVSNVDYFNERDSRGKRLSSEENWLCSRAAYHSQWHWLLSEIQHAEFALKNLRALAIDGRHTRRKQRPSPDADQCSRTVPVFGSTRRKIYKLEANTSVAELLAANADGSGVVDNEIQCNCRAPETGACVLCLGRIHRTRATRSWSQLAPTETDLIRRALPFDSSIHHKLSTPSDIPPGLIMEVRLRNAVHSSPVHWAIPRPVNIPIPSLLHATTTVPSSPPCANSSSSSDSPSAPQQAADIPPESLSSSWYSESGQALHKKRKLDSSDDGSSAEYRSESRRASQDNLSETCPSPGLQCGRITRLPCVDLELPSWRVCPLTSAAATAPTVSSLPVHCTPTSYVPPAPTTPSPLTGLLHVHTTSRETPVIQSDKKSLKLMVVPENSHKEDTSDEVYLYRHGVEEAFERDRVCGVVLTGQSQSSRSGRRIVERMAAVDGGWDYQVAPLPGYLPRHFPLSSRDLSIIADEQLLEEEAYAASPRDNVECKTATSAINEVPW